MIVGMIVTMHAIEIAETGGPEVLQYVEKPMPSPGPGEVVIKAEAIGVNFIDTYFRSGLYPREVPFVLGTEVCGTVEAVGDDVAALAVGDRVVTARAVGAYAEYCVGAADFCAYVPEGVSSGRGRRLPAQGHDGALPDQVGVSGSAGRHRAGARGRRRCRADPDAVGHQPGRPGDHHRVDAGEGRAVPAGGRRARCSTIRTIPQEFGAKIKDLTDGGVAAVYDGVGAATFEASLASLAVRGTLALFGASSGPVPPFDPQRLNAAGSVFLTRPNLVALHPHAPTNSLGAQANCSMRSQPGTINVTVSERYRLEDAEQAHRDLRAARPSAPSCWCPESSSRRGSCS